MVSVVPKLLCRWCNNKESHHHNEYEDEVVYGEVRHPNEPHNKHIHNTHFSNALYLKCTESTGSTGSSNENNDSCTFIKDNNIQTTCERDVSYTPDIPPYYGSDVDSIIKKTGSMQRTKMIESPSHHLENETIRKDNLKEREATNTPEVPPYLDSDDDGVTMTQSPSYHLREDNNATVNYIKLVPICEREVNHTLDVSLCHASDDDNDSITMTRNPSYNLGRDFFTEANTLDSIKLLLTCEREYSQAPHISPHNDSDNIDINQNASCCLEKKFSAEANRVNGTGLVPTSELESDNIPPVPSYNSDDIYNAIKKSDIDSDSIIMTDNPSYQFEKDFFIEQ